MRNADGTCRLLEVSQGGRGRGRGRELDAPADGLVRIEIPDEARRLLPRSLRQELADLDAVYRFSTPSLWEGLATAVIRQVIRADHARRVFQSVCESFGTPTRRRSPSDLGPSAFPDAEVLLANPDEALRAVGLGFKVKILRRVGAQLPATDVAAGEIPEISGVGPWTLQICRMDISSDFAHYPFEDLAVRALANRYWPSVDWPSETRAFRTHWLQKTGPHAGALTALLFAHSFSTQFAHAA